MTTLSLHDLAMAYPASAPLFEGLTLEVGDGELLALAGPSGCGKTTLLRIIAGLAEPTAGDVAFDGRSVLGLRPEQRETVLVFQENTLFPFRDVGTNVAFGLRMRGVSKADRRRRVRDALAEVRLEGFERRWPAELSGGQRQRVALARALVVRPRLLLLDEPLSSLDPELRNEVRSTIRRIQRGHKITTVMVTHDRDDAEAIADRLLELHDGELRPLLREGNHE
ncbi:MAG: ABC transporter ATP-binding protein [Actinomycetota bacterium]